ncbi:RNA-binding S4 domain-containing protein [Ideonella sp. B7]|uniref:RNA-binding S4 domain-containing protein n=1 Tax=Ideonella benzenivorans TaxID=2831643 RepID=UPI001CED3072|nr:RNA-binding S4 domain-containing protein [Ideonella benzenivorans]MCA6217531.1 RNA-binding S4 domain-containing protein [Ideonella benzenivorans]
MAERSPASEASGVRLDKWLWAARFFKTRSLAVEAIGKNRVDVNGQPAKASREVRPGDLVLLREPGQPPRELQIRAISQVRGPAPVAQQLYEETASSLAAREAAREARRQGIEPAQAIIHGRPTKRDRRQLTDWARWSVSLDEE